MGLITVIIVVVLIVLGLGLLILALLRRSQSVVPDVADREAARRDRVVAIDDQGRPVTESQADDDTPPRDAAAFEDVLKEQLDDLHP